MNLSTALKVLRGSRVKGLHLQALVKVLQILMDGFAKNDFGDPTKVAGGCHGQYGELTHSLLKPSHWLPEGQREVSCGGHPHFKTHVS